MFNRHLLLQMTSKTMLLRFGEPFAELPIYENVDLILRIPDLVEKNQKYWIYSVSMLVRQMWKKCGKI
jgi:hypothetical protein